MLDLQYLKYRPRAEELQNNQPRALLDFAGRAILDEVRERRRKWTWAYLAERRDDRHRYVELFKKKNLNGTLVEPASSKVVVSGTPCMADHNIE